MITLGFSRPRAWNPFSWLILLVTGSPASHAWWLVDDPIFGTRMVQEAHTGGFRLISFEAFSKSNVIVGLATPRYPVDLKGTAQWMGYSYDMLGVFGMLWVMLGRWLKKKWENPFQSTSALFCSESVVRVLHLVGYPGVEDLVPESTTPQDLLLRVRTSTAWQYVPGDDLMLG